MSKKVAQEVLPDKLKKWQHVSVTWEDAYINNGPQDSTKWKHQPCIRVTSGYVIRYTPDYLAFAVTDERRAQLDEDTDCENINVVPRAYIRKIVIA